MFPTGELSRDDEEILGYALRNRWCLSPFLKAGRAGMDERWPDGVLDGVLDGVAHTEHDSNWQVANGGGKRGGSNHDWKQSRLRWKKWINWKTTTEMESTSYVGSFTRSAIGAFEGQPESFWRSAREFLKVSQRFFGNQPEFLKVSQSFWRSTMLLLEISQRFFEGQPESFWRSTMVLLEISQRVFEGQPCCTPIIQV